MSENTSSSLVLQAFVKTILTQLEQSLPSQPPLTQFSYQNPLHEYQHLPFEQAVALSGSHGYLPDSQFRQLYCQGAITDTDIAAVFAQESALQAEEILLFTQPVITYAAVYKVLMLFDFEPILPSELAWQIEELNILEKFQPDVPLAIQQQALGSNPTQTTETKLIADLWQTVLNKLDLEASYLHPENMLDLSLDQAEALLAQYKAAQRKVSLKKSTMQERMQEAAVKMFMTEQQHLGQHKTLRHLIMSLCGVDILDNVRSQMTRICSSGLDEGMAAWTLPESHSAGLYNAWRAVAGLDINPFLQELPDWQAIIAELPDDPEAAIMLQLNYFEIPPAQWSDYLQALSLEMSGWTGIINWRMQHPEYLSRNASKPTLADYLAIRLTLDRLWLNQICRNTWGCDANLSSLSQYFRKHASEYMVRWHLFQGNLPEHLIQQAEALSLNMDDQLYNRAEWQNLADIIWTWQGSRILNSRLQHSVYDSAWLLFRLSQHLGLNAEQLQNVNGDELEHTLKVMHEFTRTRRSPIWLMAYEQHYRESLLQMLPTKASSAQKNIPAAQFIFSIDHREESLRRWLELSETDIVTFGVPRFISAPAENSNPLPKLYTLCHHLWQFTQGGNLFITPVLMTLAAPLLLGNLLAKVFVPRWQQACALKLRQQFIPNTAPLVTAEMTAAAIEHIAQLLRTIGLTQDFSPIVVLMGRTAHGQHNHHAVAFTQADSVWQQAGLHAAVMAELINRPNVHAALAQLNIHIPEDTYFISAEHNTANESITWHALNALPSEHTVLINQLQADCLVALQKAAQERCQELPPAVSEMNNTAALQRVQTRSANFAERKQEPDYTNAIAAVIGPRSLTQTLILNRQVFLISYDSAIDTNGTQLDILLMNVIPMLSAVNLSYYFATVDSARFGSGDSLRHNVIAQLGVMEGTCSDVRYGIPLHMVKNHAAMRLHVVIETPLATLQQIVARRPALQQLIQNHWLSVSVRDPETLTLNPVFTYG